MDYKELIKDLENIKTNSLNEIIELTKKNRNMYVNISGEIGNGYYFQGHVDNGNACIETLFDPNGNILKIEGFAGDVGKWKISKMM